MPEYTPPTTDFILRHLKRRAKTAITDDNRPMALWMYRRCLNVAEMLRTYLDVGSPQS